MIDYDKLKEYTPLTLQRMKCIESALCDGPKRTAELQAILRDHNFGDSLRNVQDAIKKLNDVYGSEEGDNHISRGAVHKLSDTEVNLAFPELVVNSKDRRVMNKILRLAYFFEGTIPVKRILEVSGLVKGGMDDLFDDMRENADLPMSAEEAALMANLYDAIERKRVVCFPYKPLHDVYYGDEIHVSPYYLRQFNSKWFLIGHIENQPVRDVGFNYPWSVFPIKRILSEGGTFFQLKMSDRRYRDIDKKRIHEYYSHVIGFYVPGIKGEPFKEQLQPLEIVIKVADSKTIRQIVENPIHDHQSVDRRTGTVILNVVESPLLYSRLLSYGADIEVISPVTVWDKLHEMFVMGSKVYEQVKK